MALGKRLALGSIAAGRAGFVELDLRYGLRTELGWRPERTDFMAGLQETIKWCRDNESWWAAAKDATETRCAEWEWGGDLRRAASRFARGRKQAER